MKRLRALFLFDLAVTGILLLGISQPASAQTQACAAPWQVGISITVGEVLSYGGHNWKAIQGGYTTIDGWQPPNTPALWTDLGRTWESVAEARQRLRQHRLLRPHGDFKRGATSNRYSQIAPRHQL